MSRPHHAEPLSGIRGPKVVFLPLFVETAHFNIQIPFIHKGLIPYPAFRFILFFRDKRISPWTFFFP
jgi:hypothetical protein